MTGPMELLAPAGGWEALAAVVEAGADAVYFSEKRFAMRQHGAWLNFESAEIPKVVDTLHRQGKSAYLALNNLLTSGELTLLRHSLPQWAAAGVDAFIVQDLGLLRLVHQLCPQVPIHASTMMNLHHGLAAGLLRRWGVTRVIASRDITLAAAAKMGEEGGVEVEYFVHGDMCVAQGGQCYHSGIAAGYSANRGKCLKGCRWQWTWLDRDKNRNLGHVKGGYLLARKDLCLYHQLPECYSLGIRSLKIEGRARPASYLGPIVAAYRQAMDRYVAHPLTYTTDFATLNFLRGHTLREVTTGHAFHRPGAEATDLSGKREPRFFSIAIEERPYQPQVAPANPPQHLPELSVRCATVAQVYAVADTPCHWITLSSERLMSHRQPWPPGTIQGLMTHCRARGKRFAIATPRTTTQREMGEVAQLVAELAATPPDEYLVANLGTLALLRSLGGGVPLHGDFSLNLWNPQAVAFLAAEGVALVTPGVELTVELLLELARHTPLPLACLVHGPLPAMIMDYCPMASQLTGTSKEEPCPGPCQGRGFALLSPQGKRHWLEADQYCRNYLYMEKDLCTIDHVSLLRQPNVARVAIEGMLYTPNYLAQLVTAYASVLQGEALSQGDIQELQHAAPRPWSLGAYASGMEAISEPCQELPTNWVIRAPP